MTTILIPKNFKMVDKILDENKITYQKLNENYISIDHELNIDLTDKISKFDHVFIIENNSNLIGNYIKKDKIFKLDLNDDNLKLDLNDQNDDIDINYENDINDDIDINDINDDIDINDINDENDDFDINDENDDININDENDLNDDIDINNDIDINDDEFKLDLINEDNNLKLENKKKSKSYFPNEVSKIYNVSRVSSKRKKIAIIELGGGYRANDLSYYWNLVGLSKNKYPTVKSISVNGAKNNPGFSSDDDEVYLDIEIIGAISPNSIINVYFAPNSNRSFFNAIAKAISDKNNIICICWGAPEMYFSKYTLNSFNALFKKACKRGITVFVASGDNGYKDNGTKIGVDFPASSPYVVAVGGTHLYTDKSERAWSGSGGGYSNHFNKLSYQNKIEKNKKKRCVPDVSADADPNSGIKIYINGSLYVIGGTSAAAPIWTGCFGALNKSGFINYKIYKLIGTKSFHDIKKGSNGYKAKKGYDLCTGIGTPNFKYLVKHI